MCIEHDDIDRISPARRPNDRVVMSQNWRNLLFLHWRVPAPALQSLVPSGLTIDTFQGEAYVGLVPFTMRDIHPTGLPTWPPLSNFHEVNVRTYVHRGGNDPGVWFFSLDAANLAGVSIARALFKLPYYFARMRMETTDTATTYVSERLGTQRARAHCALTYTPLGNPAPAIPGTLDHFLLERYILYSNNQSRLLRGQVHHLPYLVSSAAISSLDETLIAAAGITVPMCAPIVHYSAGVDVSVFPLYDAAQRNPRP